MKKRLFGLASILLLTGCGGTGNPSSAQPSLPPASEKESTVSNAPSDEQKPSDPGSTSSDEAPVEYSQGIYSNPVGTYTPSGTPFSAEMADPSVIRDPETGMFYAFGTNRTTLMSEDGCDWTQVSGEIINFPSWQSEVANNPGSVGMWAPDVQKVGDNWIYYYSLSGWGDCAGIGFGISDSLAGPYVDQGKLFTYKEIGVENAIDPQVYVDDDDRVWMTFGSFQGIYQVELTSDGMGLKNGLAYQKDNKILIGGYAGGWDGSTYEGSYIIKHDDDYIYLGSSGTCCEGVNSTYRVVAGKADNINGPFLNKTRQPMTQSRSGTTIGELVLWAGMSSDKNIAGPGHCSVIVDDAGDYWLYYHAYSSVDNFRTRHLFMDKLLWDDAGFPYVETKKPSFQEDKEGPSIAE